MQFAHMRAACGFPQTSQTSSTFGGGRADAVDACVDAEGEEGVAAVERGSGGREVRRSKGGEEDLEEADGPSSAVVNGVVGGDGGGRADATDE